MINLKDDVNSALSNNQALIDLLNGDYIWVLTTPEAHRDKTRVTFFQITNFDSAFSDDQEYASDIHFQVDVWSPGNTTPVANEVDKTMKSLDFVRTGARDDYEEDTKTYHESLRYKTRKRVN
jgi:hypothetical protein